MTKRPKKEHLTDDRIVELRQLARATSRQIVVRHTYPKADLRLRVSPGGCATWYVRREVDKQKFQPTIGRWPDMTIYQAELKAIDKHKELKDGYRPAPKPRANGNAITTVAETLDVMIVKRCNTIGERTASDYKKDIARLGWQRRTLASIEEHECLDKMKRFEADGIKPSGIVALKTLSRIYKFAKRQGLYLGTNPCEKAWSEGWPTHAQEQTRFADQQDWARAFKVASTYPERVFATHWILCSFMPNRPWSELGGLRWDEIDFDRRTIFIPAKRLKVKNPDKRKMMHRDPRGLMVPMVSQVEEALRELHAISGIKDLSEQQRAHVFRCKRKNTELGHVRESSNHLLSSLYTFIATPQRD